NLLYRYTSPAKPHRIKRTGACSVFAYKKHYTIKNMLQKNNNLATSNQACHLEMSFHPSDRVCLELLRSRSIATVCLHCHR
ncbi:hypothetical protein LINGRAHAP2_LOCUS6517, partial [Linum grandiflorum]